MPTDQIQPGEKRSRLAWSTKTEPMHECIHCKAQFVPGTGYSMNGMAFCDSCLDR